MFYKEEDLKTHFKRLKIKLITSPNCDKCKGLKDLKSDLIEVEDLSTTKYADLVIGLPIVLLINDGEVIYSFTGNFTNEADILIKAEEKRKDFNDRQTKKLKQYFTAYHSEYYVGLLSNFSNYWKCSREAQLALINTYNRLYIAINNYNYLIRENTLKGLIFQTAKKEFLMIQKKKRNKKQYSFDKLEYDQITNLIPDIQTEPKDANLVLEKITEYLKENKEQLGISDKAYSLWVNYITVKNNNKTLTKFLKNELKISYSGFKKEIAQIKEIIKNDKYCQKLYEDYL